MDNESTGTPTRKNTSDFNVLDSTPRASFHKPSKVVKKVLSLKHGTNWNLDENTISQTSSEHEYDC